MFVRPAITFSSHFTFFSLFQKVKSSQKTVQFLLIVYKIFHFNIQPTAKIEHEPKTNMQRRVDLRFWILKLKGLLFNPKQAEFATQRQHMQSISR